MDRRIYVGLSTVGYEPRISPNTVPCASLIHSLSVYLVGFLYLKTTQVVLEEVDVKSGEEEEVCMSHCV